VSLYNYVYIPVLLSKPEPISEAFRFYDRNSIQAPSQSSFWSQRLSSLKFTPKAIPLPLAPAALSSAFGIISLPVGRSVIESTVATTIPTYVLSSHIIHQLQQTLDPTLATWLGSVGMLAYLTSTLTPVSEGVLR
jgi:hypothetical protein